jgi:pimeloyl-ACP methyl ester carboxylesterase
MRGCAFQAVNCALWKESLPSPRHYRRLSTLRHVANTRDFSTTTSRHPAFDSTPLGKHGQALLQGLDVYTVPALGDDHPLAVYGIHSTTTTRQSLDKESNMQQQQRRPILLLHGRTWSAVPVYHLLGGHGSGSSTESSYHDEESATTNGSTTNTNSNTTPEPSRSMMEALWHKGLQPYTMDFRGFGGTPPDATGYVEPLRCVHDAETVLTWIHTRHAMADHDYPALLGWSQGALIAQLLAQKPKPPVSKLILYGSIYDPLVRYPREPLYQMRKVNTTIIQNTMDDAMEDFTIEGSIPPTPARKFAEAALLSDPIKAVWKHSYQFNNCDPARVHCPTMVIAGDQDPYAPLHVQQELFCNLGRGSDRTWSILADSDHAVHLLQGRDRFMSSIVSFILNGKRSELNAGH